MEEPSKAVADLTRAFEIGLRQNARTASQGNDNKVVFQQKKQGIFMKCSVSNLMVRPNFVISFICFLTFIFLNIGNGTSLAQQPPSGTIEVILETSETAITHKSVMRSGSIEVAIDSAEAEMIEKNVPPMESIENLVDENKNEPVPDASGETRFMRPAALMVENEPPARPQSGLFAAKILYEIQAEEVTRFMAIYYDLTQNIEVGPIRSARHYFADISTMFDAVYVHVGGSPMGLAEISERHISDINAIKGDLGFYRTSERRIPHNLYIKLPNLKKEIVRKKFAVETQKALPFNFYGKRMTSEELQAAGVLGRTVKKLHIPYMKGYRVSYEFEGERFTRLYNDRPFCDYRTNAKVCADNVVVMRCHMHMIDESMRHDMDLYEGGTCEISIGNHFFVGSWDRDRKSGIIKYYDSSLNEVKFNPGNIIVHVIPPKQSYFVDEQAHVYGEDRAKQKKSVKRTKKGGSASEVEEVETEGPPF